MPFARLLAALAVCAIALAACGSASKPTSSGSAGPQALDYLHCLRANGVNSELTPVGAVPNLLSPAVRAAAKACAKLKPVGVQLGLPPAPTPGELRAALAFARCMRGHGVPQFPDPLRTDGPDADLSVGRGEFFSLNSPTELQSPAFRRAANACGARLATGPPP
jgi:hypothetical protein